MNQITTEKPVTAFKSAPMPSNRPPETEQILLARLHEIIDLQLLSALFQPIIQLQNGEIVGYEGLIRRPSDSPLHFPEFIQDGMGQQSNPPSCVEKICRTGFARKNIPQRQSGVSFATRRKYGQGLDLSHQIGIHPECVIIELTENQPAYDYQWLGQAVTHYRQMGFQIAIDDLRVFQLEPMVRIAPIICKRKQKCSWSAISA